MSDTATHHADEQRTLGALSRRLVVVGVAVGVIGLVLAAVAAIAAGPGDEAHHGVLRRFLLGYVAGLSYFLSISCGALIFVLLQHLCRSGWSVTVRRLAEIMAANLQTLAVLTIPVVLAVLFGGGVLYHWNDAELVAADHLLQAKSPWLNKGFFTLRIVLYFAFYIAVARFYLGRSRRFDTGGDVADSAVMQERSGPLVLLFGLVVSFTAFDLVMSLDPHWFSTIFGVYFFAGGYLNFFASIMLFAFLLQKRGILSKSINDEHYHDLGKFMFGFVFFWGYVAFSQYMLIWYGNLPEETLWFARRGVATGQEYDAGTPGWGWVAILLLVCHFMIPFAALLSRWSKRITKLRNFWIGWILVMHFVDMCWLVMPEMKAASIGGSVATALCATIGVGGLWLAGLGWLAGADRSLLAVHDPRLDQALHYENI